MRQRALKTLTISFALLALLGSVQARLALASGQPQGLPLVEGISIHKGPDGTVTIDVAVSGPVPYKTLRLSGPDRLVLDLTGARQSDLKRNYPAASQVLKRVRAGQWKYFPAVFRVVADLKGHPAFSIKRQPSGFQIELKPRGMELASNHDAGAPATESPVKAAKPARQTAREDPPPDKVFQVHRFKDLSASLTAPAVPPHDRLIPVTNPDPPTRSPKQASTIALVSGISVKPNSKGETTIDIASTRSVPYRVFQLTKPFRLVIDLENARNASRQDVYKVNSPVLKSVRVAQWRPTDPPVVRVVADLEGYPIFDVHAQRPGVRVELRSRPPMPTITRNPFKFKPEHRSAPAGHAAAQANQAVTARANSPAALPGNVLPDLKVIGLIEKKETGTEAVISDHANLYLVPKGGTFEDTFTVLAISPNAVEIQNIKTSETFWLAYTP